MSDKHPEYLKRCSLHVVLLGGELYAAYSVGYYSWLAAYFSHSQPAKAEMSIKIASIESGVFILLVCLHATWLLYSVLRKPKPQRVHSTTGQDSVQVVEFGDK